MTSSEELQRAIKTKLEATPTVMALAYRVYDNVPASSPYGGKSSYLAFGPMDTVDDDADCISGVETTMQIDVWSRKEGAIECRKLTDLVRKALHRQPLALDASAAVDMRVALTRVFPDPSGEHHGVVQVTVMIEEDWS